MNQKVPKSEIRKLLNNIFEEEKTKILKGFHFSWFEKLFAGRVLEDAASDPSFFQ